jgi:protein-disulfide isomerase
MAKKSTRRPPKRSTKAAPKKKQNRTIFWIAIGLGVVLIAALAAMGYINSQKNNAPAASVPTIDERTGQPMDRTTLGDPNAPVLVETYEDFLCPHCADFTAELGPVLLDLVRDGTVRWDYKYRVIGGSNSLTANMAAECAADQGMFWEYHEEMFRQFSFHGKSALFPDNLKQMAADMGMNAKQFNHCLDSKQHLAAIQEIDQAAAARGVNGTPTIFINGQRYNGPRTPEDFRAAIAAAAQ